MGKGTMDGRTRGDGTVAPTAAAEAMTLRTVDAMADIDPVAWDRLVDAAPAPSPFLRHAFLEALESSGCVGPDTGWQPLHLLAEDTQGRLLGAVPLYAKSHSYGEYVFDWAWADAHERAGLRYYPKLLGALPFTPVPGTRLLADGADDAARASVRSRLLDALAGLGRRLNLSSAHLLFVDGTDEAAITATASRWLVRHGVQFHWSNPPAAPWRDFDHFLDGLQREKRKKIRQERRRVAEAGVTLTRRVGAAITEDDWRFFVTCYERTYAAHGASPYLNLDFFLTVARTMPENWLMVLASDPQGRRIAAALIGLDPARRVAYGRYWGCVEEVPCLHFEACYYQPLQWCIEQGWQRFEGGAQGEHKMARGLLPVPTRSLHWLAAPRFEAAIDRHLARESEAIDEWSDALRRRTPFRDLTPP
jgi:predicted N-acyltransferase